jgi:preprotein translocase subunit SecE
MADKEKTSGKKVQGKAQKAQGKQKKWAQGLKAEFNKIVWTDRATLVNQTIVVVTITVILGALISILDAGILQCLNVLIK